MEEMAMHRSHVAPWEPHDRLRAFVGALALHAKDWIEDRRYVEEHRRFIEDLEESGDLAAYLEALGATPEELKAWSISPVAASELLARMMARLGVDQDALLGNMLLREDLERACRCCASWKQCRRWLRDTRAEPGEFTEFCPNAGVLERLRHTARSGE
jgi:hypothetical protein